MGLHQPHVIDAASISAAGCAVLNILDSWDWTDEAQHLGALDDKLRTYLGSIQSGEILESYPPARGRTIEILWITKYPLNPGGIAFRDRALQTCAAQGIEFQHWYYPGKDT